MSNAKQSKVSVAAAKSVETAKECLIQVGEAFITKDAAAKSAKDAMVRLIKTKVTLGNLKTCAMAQFYRDHMASKGYAAGTISNQLNAIRRAIKTGGELDLNASRTKAKAAGQSKTPAKKDKAALVEANVMEDDSEMASDEPKTPAVKPGAFKSNDDAIAALKTAIKNVKLSCTLKQWEAIQTLYPQIGKLTD